MTDSLRVVIAPVLRVEGAGETVGRRRDSGDVSAGPPNADSVDTESFPFRAGLRNAAAEIVRTPRAPEVSEDVDFAMSGDENGGCGRGYSGGGVL